MMLVCAQRVGLVSAMLSVPKRCVDGRIRLECLRGSRGVGDCRIRNAVEGKFVGKATGRNSMQRQEWETMTVRRTMPSATDDVAGLSWKGFMMMAGIVVSTIWEGPVYAIEANPVVDLSEGLETPVQLIYLLTLLGFLVVGAFLVVRQVLIRRELEEAAKVLGDRVRSGEATCEDHFELGVILLRKKLFTQATKSLERALKEWEGEEEELAQVHNALGYAYFNLEKLDKSVKEYREAVRLQPGYVTAWNNLGDALEKLRQFESALEAYEEALAFAPDNKIAQSRADFCRTRVQRTSGVKTR